ncbi:MAG: DUF4363 family protein, partial [Clostridia bacterium]|nr:DUF4363 family protein [Clostridia bacterium]
SAGFIFGGLIIFVTASERFIATDASDMLKQAERAIIMLKKNDFSASEQAIQALEESFMQKRKVRLSLINHEKADSMHHLISEAEFLVSEGAMQDAADRLVRFCFLLRDYQENTRIKWYNIL